MPTIFHYLKYIPFLVLFLENLEAQTLPPPPAVNAAPSISINNPTNVRYEAKFEACPGDSVTFTYRNLSAPPTKIVFRNNAGSNAWISLNQSNTTQQEIRVRIPSNAVTGLVYLYNYTINSPLITSRQHLIINKPLVDFYLPPSPFCATDTIPMIGIPSGGIFSAHDLAGNSVPSLTTNTSLIGINAGWSTSINELTKDFRIEYAYTPKYLSGRNCPNPITTVDTIEIRDNRLDALEFNYKVINNTPTINDRITLDASSSTLSNFSPNFTYLNYPTSFTGNYVNLINGDDVFFTEDAGYGSHPITLQYNNGGCIGSATANLDILQSLRLSGQVDTLCRDADPITIIRDARPEYAYSNTTTITGTGTTRMESNIILSVSTRLPSHQSAINTVNSTSGQEEYTLHPNSLPNGLDTVFIVMRFRSHKTTVTNNSGSIISIDTATISTVEYPIILVDRPTLSFALDSNYCKNSAPVQLSANPTFNPSYSHFTPAYSTSPSGPFSPADTLQNNQFNPNSIHNQAVASGAQNQDVHVQLTYTVNRYGCTDFHTQNTSIDSIPNVSLNGLGSTYCVYDSLVQLNGFPISSTGIYTGLGIQDTSLGTFSPAVVGLGSTTIIYSVGSVNGCIASDTATTIIQATFSPQYTFPKTQYCASDSIVQLDSAFTYWGNLIDSTNILNPQNALGQQTIFYMAANGSGCSDTGSTIILINRLPTILLGGLDSAYCINSSIDNNIFVSPTVSSADIVGSSLGFSISSTGNIAFDPHFDSSGIKTFIYKYKDDITECTDSILVNITVYDIPILSTGLDSTYCNVNDTTLITGVPSGGVFSGPGISSNSAGQYYFNPALSGGGSQTINYALVDVNILPNSSDTLSCPVELDIPVVIHQLPNLQFSGPGNNKRFCSNEADVLLGRSEPLNWRLFTSSTLGAVERIDSFLVDTTNLTVRVDTSYYFSPSHAGEKPEGHEITYRAKDTNTGCQDSMSLIYYVTDYGEGASFLLNSAYCTSNDSIFLIGSPNGGKFTRNGDTLSDYRLSLSTATYDLDSINHTPDTIIYEVKYGAVCIDSDTQFVDIHPIVDLSFEGEKPSKTYCLGDENSPLVPNILGGTFVGGGVISRESLFSIQYANLGDNIITYNYTNNTTGCESTISDTFFVYSMPDVNFQVVGGCQLDSILFYPDNSILGLNVLVDAITSISWELETGFFIQGSNDSSNAINSVHHIYNFPGIYETKLAVTNKGYCADTATVRVVISPTINSNQFPYDETFEDSTGNWYPEAKDNSHNLLWERGPSTTDTSNAIWATQLNDQYTANEAAWVYSPCFDISALDRPMIRFDHWSDSRNRGDGAVLEFQKPDGTWSPLGEVGRGINWFNSDFIAGAPGNQTLSPIGWSGKSEGWVDSRYKLDEFKNTANSKLRLRMAFGSSAINLGSFHNGFAFDNVWIGNRTRNVLLETTSNIYEPNMNNINHGVYQLVYHNRKDVILLQYHSEAPNNNDEFHQYNIPVANARTLFYGIFDAGVAFIDGIRNTRSQSLTDSLFEQNMLESPKFKVEIDNFSHQNPGQFILTTTVTALENIPNIERYRINMLITEDLLSYSTGEEVHAVVRKDYPSNSINTFDRRWVKGEQVTLTHTYSVTDLNYDPNTFQAVVFIQAQLDSARTVFQTATTRDLYGHWVGVDQIATKKELNEIKDINLYPNPAKDYITIDFPQVLEKDYNWKLVALGGLVIKEDVMHAGEQSLIINHYDLPSGVYIFMVYNDHVYAQRKVIINQD